MADVDARVASHGRPEDRCAAGDGGTAADVSFSVTICPHCAALLLPSSKSERARRIKIKMPQHLRNTSVRTSWRFFRSSYYIVSFLSFGGLNYRKGYKQY